MNQLHKTVQSECGPREMVLRTQNETEGSENSIMFLDLSTWLYDFDNALNGHLNNHFGF